MMKKMAFESKYVTAGEDFPQRRRRLRCFPAKVLFPQKLKPSLIHPGRRKAQGEMGSI